MKRDGSLTGIQFRWFANPSHQAATLDLLWVAKRQNRVLACGLALLAIAFALVILLSVRLRLAKRSSGRPPPSLNSSPTSAMRFARP